MDILDQNQRSHYFEFKSLRDLSLGVIPDMTSLARDSLNLSTPDDLGRTKNREIILKAEYRHKSVLRAYVELVFDGVKNVLNLDYDLGDPSAKNWIRDHLEECLLGKGLNPLTVLPLCYGELLPSFQDCNFGIKDVFLGGNVDIATATLLSLNIKGKLPHELGLRVKLLVDKDDIEKIIDIKKSAFQFAPFDCHIFGQVDYYTIEKQRLVVQLKNRRSFGFFQDDEMVGYMGYVLRTDVDQNIAAGLDLALLPELQNIHLGTYCYRFLIHLMKRDKIKHFFGHTSNGAVLHFGSKLKRPLYALTLARKDLCPAQKRFAPIIGKLG